MKGPNLSTLPSGEKGEAEAGRREWERECADDDFVDDDLSDNRDEDDDDGRG